MGHDGERLTRELLSRAHSPDSTERIYTDKIQHRSLHLRPSSPPPSALNKREARRRSRQQAKERQKLKPKPLSSRERRALGLYDIPKEGHKYEIYEPLHKLWLGYMREVLGNEVKTGGPAAAAKLSSAEFHGAKVEVVRSRCPGRVGISGIVVRDRKFVVEVITVKRGLKVVPKEGTTFRIAISVADEVAEGVEKQADLVFDILGDQMMLRSVDRANRKFKPHFLENI